MSEEVKNEYTGNNISTNTSVRLPIGLLATFVLAVAIFLFNKQDILNSKVESYYHIVTLELENKANKESIKDRYTGSDADKDKEIYKISIEALQREFITNLNSIEKDMQHIYDDIKNHYHPHSQIIHEQIIHTDEIHK